MSPIAVLAALVTLFGLAVALRATNGRMTVVGLGLVLLPLPLAVGDAPPPLVLAFRTLAVLLALFLLDLGVRRTTPLVGAIRLGGSAEIGVVIGAWLIGWLLASSTTGAAWPAMALATALALAVAGLTLLAFGSDTLRLGAGATFVLAAGAALVPALGGATGDALELSLAGALVAVAGATAWLAVVGGQVRHDLELVDRPIDLPRDLPRERLREPSRDTPRETARRALPQLTRRQQRTLGIGLATALLVIIAFVGGPVFSGWLQGLGGGGVASGTATPTFPVGSPGASVLPSAEPSPTAFASAAPTASATPEPTLAPLTYVVVKGDTLGAIARRFGVTVTALQEANDITDPAKIRIGQKLIIPRP